MLTNFYPISAKHLPVNRLGSLSQLMQAVKALGWWQSKRYTTQPAATHYNHLGQWAQTFNQILAGHQGTIITDNSDIKIHQSGELGQLRLYGEMGVLQGGEIDAYFYTENWREINHRQESMTGSLTCHDDSQHNAWQLSSQRLNNKSAHPNLSLSLPAQYQPTPRRTVPGLVETNELRQMWASLTQVHQFYDMLSLFKLGLLDAIKLMQDQWTHPISSCQLISFLQQCQERNLKSKILTGNRGILHVLKPPILQFEQKSEQLSISGHNYSCQLNLPAIKQVWLVKRATKLGIVHSLEAFDCHDRLIMQVQEQRQSKQADTALWIRCLERQSIIPKV